MKILKYIKDAVLSVDPQAEVFLFGSRARGKHKPDADWDILVLIPEYDFFGQKQKILNSVLEIEMNNDLLINVIVQKKDNWNNNKLFSITPFYKSVVKDYQKIQ